jgi:hypothetical protein
MQQTKTFKYLENNTIIQGEIDEKNKSPRRGMRGSLYYNPLPYYPNYTSNEPYTTRVTLYYYPY